VISPPKDRREQEGYQHSGSLGEEGRLRLRRFFQFGLNRLLRVADHVNYPNWPIPLGRLTFQF
jgi:hypothetical protein